MGKKSYPSSGRARGKMSLVEARSQVRPRIEDLVREWHKQNPTLATRQSGQVTFLEDFGLRRQANGTLKLITPDATGHIYMYRESGVDLDKLRDWLMNAALMKIRLLVIDEMNRLTGRSSRNMRDLGGLERVCGNFLTVLLGDQPRTVLEPALIKWLDFLDPEVLELTRRAHDTSTSLATYNLIAAHRALWESMEAQSPGLMPLVSYACRKKFIRFDSNALRSLKRYGKRHGLTETGWKMLCRLSADQVRYLLQFTMEECFCLVSHFGETGVVPAVALMHAHVVYCRSRNRPLGSIPAWFDRAAIAEYQREEAEVPIFRRRFLRDEYDVALDWLTAFTAHRGVPDTQQKRAGWSWIKRQSDEWHAALQEEQARRRITVNHTWNSALAAYQDDGYDIVPLTSSVDLAIEGARMHHCVGTYDLYCCTGRSRIFSIRKDGKRLATAELVYDAGNWELHQNRGPCNSAPGPALMAVARRLEDRYNAADNPSPPN